jgi:hypothetical protein
MPNIVESLLYKHLYYGNIATYNVFVMSMNVYGPDIVAYVAFSDVYLAFKFLFPM